MTQAQAPALSTTECARLVRGLMRKYVHVPLTARPCATIVQPRRISLSHPGFYFIFSRGARTIQQDRRDGQLRHTTRFSAPPAVYVCVCERRNVYSNTALGIPIYPRLLVIFVHASSYIICMQKLVRAAPLRQNRIRNSSGKWHP